MPERTMLFSRWRSAAEFGSAGRPEGGRHLPAGGIPHGRRRLRWPPPRRGAREAIVRERRRSATLGAAAARRFQAPVRAGHPEVEHCSAVHS